jgi:hypothetical protein
VRSSRCTKLGTSQVLTQALIGGEEVCTGFLGKHCVRSNVRSSYVWAHPDFEIDNRRLSFFLDDAATYGAHISEYDK